MQICIICNRDSDERGISINSAKSVYEILEYYKFINNTDIVFFNKDLDFFLLKKEYIFSNTMEDFLHYYKSENKIADTINYLKSYDMVILTTHGKYGEDGVLQKFLEENHIKYMGPSYFTASNTFNKLATLKTLWKKRICKEWFSELATDEDRLKFLLDKYKQLCIKPNNGGSSIGVSIIDNMEDGKKALKELEELSYEPLIEEVHKGIEFSVTIIGDKIYDPIEIVNKGIFTYEKKYFPTEKILYNYPAHFPKKILGIIKKKAGHIFKIFKCDYFLRIDGFYLPHKKEVIFTDLNTIPGFQLNGLFFKYKNHFEVFGHLLNMFFKKNNKKLVVCKNKIIDRNSEEIIINNNRKNVFLIFGGDSSEQNISVISGTNVLFNLYKKNLYNIYVFLLYDNKFYYLSYKEAFQNSIKDFLNIIKKHKKNHIFNLKTFVDLVKLNKGKVFIGLHGGIGEDGTLQEIFEKNQVPYTGSNSSISKLCMNKYKTIDYIKTHIKSPDIIKHLYFNKTKLICNFKYMPISKLREIWEELVGECGFTSNNNIEIFIKPNDDGCSVGAMVLKNFEELVDYLNEIKKGSNNYKNYPLSINSRDYLLCEYIKVDKIHINNNEISHKIKTGWIEGSIGFLKDKIFPASVSLANNGLLTMEEKFLHGTGVNLTPIPVSIMEEENNIIIQKVIRHIIKKFKINTYCRVDFFYNINERLINIIEINTLPALTSTTVLFQQAIYLKISASKLVNKILDF